MKLVKNIALVAAFTTLSLQAFAMDDGEILGKTLSLRSVKLAMLSECGSLHDETPVENFQQEIKMTGIKIDTLIINEGGGDQPVQPYPFPKYRVVSVSFQGTAPLDRLGNVRQCDGKFLVPADGKITDENVQSYIVYLQ